LESIKKSIKKTKSIKILPKLFLILLIFFVLYFPINYINQYINYNSSKLNTYIQLNNKIIETKSINSLTENEFYEYNVLKIEF
jgi:hypothetical protein